MIRHNSTQDLPRTLTMSDLQTAAKIGGGMATAEEIAQLLLEFSTLYRMLGESRFTLTQMDARGLAFA